MLSQSRTDIPAAIRWLNQFGIESAFFVPTATGLEKSIIDAHASLRDFLASNEVHNYKHQEQGDRVVKDCVLIQPTHLIESKISLYRPKTKKGDPRFWIKNLGDFCEPYDLIALYLRQEVIYVINLSDPEIWSLGHNNESWLHNELIKGRIQYSQPATILLQRLKGIQELGWVPSTRSGDTGVGHTLETLLGIEANSSRRPDFMGIELKAKRVGSTSSNNRLTLFAKVPDWDISNLKSSSEILSDYGYIRSGRRQLYCSISTLQANSQGLQFILDSKESFLREVYKNEVPTGEIREVVKWHLASLEKSLMEKHKETFWVFADRKKNEGEFFWFKRAIHTKNPSFINFRHLLETGIITMDHLISEKNGRVSEKGPLFKIKPDCIDLLIPKVNEYDLSH